MNLTFYETYNITYCGLFAIISLKVYYFYMLLSPDNFFLGCLHVFLGMLHFLGEDSCNLHLILYGEAATVFTEACGIHIPDYHGKHDA